MYIKYIDNELEVNLLSLLGWWSVTLCRIVLKQCLFPSDLLLVAVFSGSYLNIGKGSSTCSYF